MSDDNNIFKQPKTNEGVRFAVHSREETLKAIQRQEERRRSRYGRSVDMETAIREKLAQKPSESYFTEDPKVMKFQEWQNLRRSNPHEYARKSALMAEHREALGQAFYDKSDKPGSELLTQRRVKKALEAADEKTVFAADNPGEIFPRKEQDDSSTEKEE